MSEKLLRVSFSHPNGHDRVNSSAFARKILHPKRARLGIHNLRFGNTKETPPFIEMAFDDDFPATRERLRNVLGATADQYGISFRFEELDARFTPEEIHGFIVADALRLARQMRLSHSKGVCSEARTQQILDDAVRRSFGVEYHGTYQTLMLRTGFHSQSECLYDMNPDGTFTGQEIDWGAWD